MSRPSSPWGVTWTKRWAGSQVVMVDSRVKPGPTVRTEPPTPGTTSLVPMNQASMAGPLVSASQVCSGVASRACSTTISNGWAMTQDSSVMAGVASAGTDAGADGTVGWMATMSR